MKKLILLAFTFFSLSCLSVSATWYNNSKTFKVFTSETGDGYLIQKMKNYNNSEKGKIALAILEVNTWDELTPTETLNKINLGLGNEYLLFVVYQLRGTTRISLDILVGSRWHSLFNNEQRKYIVDQIITKMKSGNDFQAYNWAIDYVIEKSIGLEAAKKYINLSIDEYKLPPEPSNSNGFMYCILIFAFARFVYSFLNGGVVMVAKDPEKKTPYQKFYSDNFSSLKMIAWFLMGLRFISAFRPKGFGGGSSGGGGAGGSW